MRVYMEEYAMVLETFQVKITWGFPSHGFGYMRLRNKQTKNEYLPLVSFSQWLNEVLLLISNSCIAPTL